MFSSNLNGGGNEMILLLARKLPEYFKDKDFAYSTHIIRMQQSKAYSEQKAKYQKLSPSRFPALRMFTEQTILLEIKTKLKHPQNIYKG